MSWMQWVALSLACLVPCTSVAAQEDANARARAHYERGVALFDEGRFEASLAEFEAAYADSHRASLLFNIGQIHARLGHAVEATDTLARYLSEAGEIPAERRALVETELDTQRGRIGRLDVRVVPDGAAIALDDVSRGTSPLDAPLLVAAGEHLLTVSAEGHETSRTRFRIAGGEERAIDLQLVRLGAPAPAPSGPFPVLTTLGAVVAGAGLVTWVTAGALTLSEDARLSSLCASRACTESDTGTIATSRIVADVGLGVLVVGAVLTVIGAVLELTGPTTPEAGRVALGTSGVEVWW